jgi:hypothetical protein
MANGPSIKPQTINAGMMMPNSAATPRNEYTCRIETKVHAVMRRELEFPEIFIKIHG